MFGIAQIQGEDLATEYLIGLHLQLQGLFPDQRPGQILHDGRSPQLLKAVIAFEAECMRKIHSQEEDEPKAKLALDSLSCFFLYLGNTLSTLCGMSHKRFLVAKVTTECLQATESIHLASTEFHRDLQGILRSYFKRSKHFDWHMCEVDFDTSFVAFCIRQFSFHQVQSESQQALIVFRRNPVGGNHNPLQTSGTDELTGYLPRRNQCHPGPPGKLHHQHQVNQDQGNHQHQPAIVEDNPPKPEQLSPKHNPPKPQHVTPKHGHLCQNLSPKPLLVSRQQAFPRKHQVSRQHQVSSHLRQGRQAQVPEQQADSQRRLPHEEQYRRKSERRS